MGAILKFKKQLNHELHRKNESWDILGLHLIHVQKMMINEAHVQNIFEKVVVKKTENTLSGGTLIKSSLS